MSGLSVAGAVVTYAGTTAVAGVDLDVAVGEVVALLGPSGCGKSSLLRAVAGLEPLTAGRVAWDGADLRDVPVHRRGFGLMFQDGQLFTHRDVAGNVAYGLEMARVPAAERRDRVDELLELVGLAGYQRRPVVTLSGGEQQRVALARSLAPRPRLLLLDEPLSALDRSLRERLASDLHDILRRAGTTSLYVTHDHDEAFTVADRVAVMRAGELVQVGRPAELWAAPADADVAAFLGYRVVAAHGGGRLGLGPRALEVVGVVAGDGVGGESADGWADALGGGAGASAEAAGSGGHGVGGEASEGAARSPRTPAPSAEAPGSGGDGDLTGRVTAVGFSRGRTTVMVDLPDWGEQRAVAAGIAAIGTGDLVRLRLDPAGVVAL
ncbi:ABC transporter ATP-binding protein [Occultella gossypii]|uniref:ABC transporter ATP-binding protein n=1 Tax=Occultella gossypii TaxID=2800820 RepID=A0ABS7SF78_9MICO|nr:ABC transporter ATP-binding protein [Occultella gossypii]MBZ2198800.1 ABC transporter ATP-binding protein [Occultella gossypii]